MKVIYQHDRISTPIKIAKLFELWLHIHRWKRRPRLTTRRIIVFNSQIQEKGFAEISQVFYFLIKDNDYSNHIKDNGHTKLRSIFNRHNWDEKVHRSTVGKKNECI